MGGGDRRIHKALCMFTQGQSERPGLKEGGTEDPHLKLFADLHTTLWHTCLSLNTLTEGTTLDEKERITVGEKGGQGVEGEWGQGI